MKLSERTREIVNGYDNADSDYEEEGWLEAAASDLGYIEELIKYIIYIEAKYK